MIRLLILTALLVVSSADALANVSLKQVKVLSGGKVDLIFDKKVTKDLIRIEFLKEVVQLSFGETTIYPSKMIPVNGNFLVKIFAYQYSPKWVRVRFFMKGKVDDYRDRIKVDPNGKLVRIQFEGSAPALPVIEDSIAAVEKEKQDAEEKQLLEKVIKGSSPEAAKVPATNEKGTESNSALGATGDLSGEGSGKAKSHKNSESERPVLGGAKPLPSFRSVLMKLGGLVFFVLLVALGLKRLKATPKKSSILSAINRMTGGGLQKGEKMIQVVSTHHLDPKKSISVVRIGGRLLVLGLSNDSINLITQFGEDSEENTLQEGAINPAARGFADLLNSERHKPTSSDIGDLTGSRGAEFRSESPPSMIPSVRNRIRSRLEGMKPL